MHAEACLKEVRHDGQRQRLAGVIDVLVPSMVSTSQVQVSQKIGQGCPSAVHEADTGFDGDLQQP